MRTVALLTGLFMSAALISAPANAAIVVTLGGAPAGADGQVSLLAPTTYNFDTTFATFNPAGNALLVTGSSDGLYAAPFGDTTQYTTIGTTPSPGSANLILPAADLHYLGLYWGSVDTYNSITITDASGTTVINSANFPILAPATGDQGPGGSQYVNIFDSNALQTVLFSSSQRAFEFDNVSLARTVPEASTWAMMLLGFVGLGFMAYRRKQGASGFRFA